MVTRLGAVAQHVHIPGIAILGNVGLDTAVFLYDDNPDLRADGHFSRNVDSVGHAAAYAARGFQRLGREPRLVSGIGDDIAGREVRRVLAAESLELCGLFHDPFGTARSVNFVRSDGSRTFFYDGGGQMHVTPPNDTLDHALDGVVGVFSQVANWARHVLPVARLRGLPVACDLQDIRGPHDDYRRDFIANADILFASGAHLADPVAAARHWMSHGPARICIIGLGPRGALVVKRDSPRPTVVPAPPLPLPVVDTTGAGDGLATGVLDALWFGKVPLTEAITWGQIYARWTCSQVGGDDLADHERLAELRELLPVAHRPHVYWD